jgi:hypothetical protein
MLIDTTQSAPKKESIDPFSSLVMELGQRGMESLEYRN